MNWPFQEADVRAVDAQINYVTRDSLINRRFVSAGDERNTGRYEPHTVKVRDGRPYADQFDFDVHGFMLAPHKSAVKDFFDKEEVDRVYPAEVIALIQSLTGATRVVLQGWMVRTSGDLSKYEHKTAGYQHAGGVQPPAGEAHVDYTPERAAPLAQRYYEREFPNGKGYKRFLATSLWRTFSEPPQDIPLAVCDARSVARDEGTPNHMFIVDKMPDAETMLNGPWDDANAIAASIFHYNPAHRWWYFSKMNRDEVILLKFHDSDERRALRTPHTAFRDPSFADAKTRSSVEFRTIAFFE